MTTHVQIIGCGAVIHEIYKGPLIQLSRSGEIEVVALVDPDQDRAASLRSHFPKARLMKDQEPDFTRDRVHLTIVASPPGLHAEHAIAALRAGSHVLCEKPMAPDADQCGRMIDAARSADRRLAVGMTRRFNPALHKLKELLQQGRLQTPVDFVFREGGQYGWPIMTPAGFSRQYGGGGVLMDVGSHVIDTVAWLLGPLRLISYRDDALSDGVESNCRIDVETPKARGIIQLSWDQNLVNEFRVGDGVTEVVIDPSTMDHMAIRQGSDPDEWKSPTLDVRFPADTAPKPGSLRSPSTYNDCVYFQVVQVLRAIRLGESVPVPGEQARETIDFIGSCYRSASALEMGWLSKEEMDLYRQYHWSNT